MADPLRIVLEDDDNTVRVDSVTGTVETDQPDGGVVVNLDARKPKAEDGGGDKWFDNLVDDIDRMRLGQIANELYEAISADDASRQEYLNIRAMGLKMLGTKLQEPRGSVADNSAAVDGMSTVTNPLLLEACLKGWANAQAELLPSAGPVKVKDDGEETLAEDDLADSLERDLNHWFTTTASEYYPDTSHMLLWGTYFGGSGIKKVYRCPMRRRPTSESVDVKNLIVSDTTKDFRSCGRITHEIPMRPSVMKRMILIGAYRDIALTQPTPQTNSVDDAIAGIQGTSPTKTRPEDQPYTTWECQCELDLDQFVPEGSAFKGEGIPLPYLVTMDKDSRDILAIRRDWNEDDDDCERKRMYVKYPYVPGPGFYGTGLLNILGNASAAMTSAWREALDAGQFASFPGGVIDKLGGRQNSSDLRVGPAQFVPIECGGRDIRSVMMGMPYHDVTPGLLGMMDRVTQQAKEVGGVADIPSSEGIQNVPVGTMLAQIEQATKVMAAAHKGMHAAQALEIQMIVDLFRENPEDFWRSNKVCPKDYWTEEKFLQALNDCDLVPASDPNIPSHIHRIAKALAIVQLFNVPAFAGIMSAKEGLLRCLRAIREDSTGLVVDPPVQAPAPDPNMIAAEAKNTQAQTGAFKAQADAQNAAAELDIKRQQVAGEQQIAQTDLAKELVIHQDDAAQAAKSAANDHALAAADHGLATQQHGLAVQKAHHDATMDVAQHGLAVQQAINPPDSSNAG